MTRASVCFAVAALALATPLMAQELPAELRSMANCEPVAGLGHAPANALRVSGGQTVEGRTLLGDRDTLIIDGGSSKGLAVGQRFFTRRAQDWGIRKSFGVHAVNTTGGIRITAVNGSTALAEVEFACDAIMPSDFLEPYVEPTLPEGAMRTDTNGTPDFSTVGRLLYAEYDKNAAGGRDFMVADIGSARGAVPGARFAVYRDMHVAGLPLQAIGEAIVVAAQPETSVVRFTSARAAVERGDLLVLRK
jgi:hypothetical protein